MHEYVDPEVARDLPGLRLVLTAGVPGPWGEAAKSIFYVKKIDYVRVRQDGGMPNEALADWTGHTNAPQAVLDAEPARTGWAEILFLAERLEPEPRLIPTDAGERVLCFGLSHEICGEQGFAWNRRHQLLHPMMSLPDADTNPGLESVRRLAARYGYSAEVAEQADERVAQILELFSCQLAEQRKAGSEYLVGSDLTAVDIYWATFAAMLDPLPQDLCPMSDMMRNAYGTLMPKSKSVLDPALLAHRDLIYERHLELPIVL